MDIRKLNNMALATRYAKLWNIAAKTGINPWRGGTVLSRLLADCLAEMEARNIV